MNANWSEDSIPPLNGMVDTIRQRCPNDVFWDDDKDFSEWVLELSHAHSEGFNGTGIITVESLVCECPIAAIEEPDVYTVTVEYRPRNGRIAEVTSVADFIQRFDGRLLFQEALTELIYRGFYAYYDPEWLRVVIEGQHLDTDYRTERQSE